MNWSFVRISLLAQSLLLCGIHAETAPDNTIVVHPLNRPAEWNGWGLSAPPASAERPAIPHAPAKFIPVENSRTFSGRVEGLDSTEGIEIGLVSLVGAHWTNPKCYQWQPLAADGTFSITSDSFPDAAKCVVVRGPNVPATFLEHDFPAGTGGKEIVLRAEQGREIRLTAGLNSQTPLTDTHFQIFSASRQFDNDGAPLRRQRLSEAATETTTSAKLCVPNEPVAVLATAPGLAPSYQIIDPRDAAHFHFVLQKGGTLKITLLDADGNPRPGIKAKWVNPNAPLSLATGSTDKAGVLKRDGLVPGTTLVEIDGYPTQQVTLVSGHESEFVLKLKIPAQE